MSSSMGSPCIITPFMCSSGSMPFRSSSSSYIGSTSSSRHVPCQPRSSTTHLTLRRRSPVSSGVPLLIRSLALTRLDLTQFLSTCHDRVKINLNLTSPGFLCFWQPLASTSTSFYSFLGIAIYFLWPYLLPNYGTSSADVWRVFTIMFIVISAAAMLQQLLMKLIIGMSNQNRRFFDSNRPDLI